MTFLEKLNQEYPDRKDWELKYIGCPSKYDYEPDDVECPFDINGNELSCIGCWKREIPGTEETYTHEEVKEMLDITDEDIEEAIDAINEVGNPNPMTSEDVKQALRFSQKMILDSGERRQFETGAVRDIQEGKGRCDLMPLEIISSIMEDPTLSNIYMYQRTSNSDYLVDAVKDFSNLYYENLCDMFLELSIHFEEGAKKYGENNWQKGIPTKHYIDSGVRHYLKWLRGDKDEPHDRAFVWNMVCCLWTIVNKPELDSYREDEEND